MRDKAICERLVGTLRRELLDLRADPRGGTCAPSLTEHQVHYNTARPRQGIAQRVPGGEHDGGHPTAADLDADGSTENPS